MRPGEEARYRFDQIQQERIIEEIYHQFLEFKKTRKILSYWLGYDYQYLQRCILCHRGFWGFNNVCKRHRVITKWKKWKSPVERKARVYALNRNAEYGRKGYFDKDGYHSLA